MSSRFKAKIACADSILIPVEPDRVWRILSDVQGYPGWWPRSLRLLVLTNDPSLKGAEFRVQPVGGRPFCCRVENAVAPVSIRIRYFGGFIEGAGEWELTLEDGGTRVTYRVDVTAAGMLASLVSRFADLKRWHSKPMQAILRNLKQAATRPV